VSLWWLCLAALLFFCGFPWTSGSRPSRLRLCAPHLRKRSSLLTTPPCTIPPPALRFARHRCSLQARFPLSCGVVACSRNRGDYLESHSYHLFRKITTARVCISDCIVLSVLLMRVSMMWIFLVSRSCRFDYVSWCAHDLHSAFEVDLTLFYLSFFV